MENKYIIILLIIILITIGITSIYIYKLYLRVTKIHYIISVDSMRLDKSKALDKIDAMHTVMMMMKFEKILEKDIENKEEE